MRLPLLLTTTALLVTSSTSSPAQPLLDTPIVREVERPAKGNSTALKSNARASAADDDDRVLRSPSFLSPVDKTILEQNDNIKLAINFIIKECQETNDLSNAAGGSTQKILAQEDTKLLQLLQAKFMQGTKHVQDRSKGVDIFSPAFQKNPLLNWPVEELVAKLDTYNLRNHPMHPLNPVLVLRTIYTDAKLLEAIVEVARDPKKGSIATRLKDDFLRLLFNDMITAREEIKLLKLDRNQPKGLWTETFAPFSPVNNYRQLQAWCFDGLITDDMVRLLLDEPNDVVIQDGSLFKAFATYIGLWNTKLSPMRLTLFESMTAHFGDYDVARMCIASRDSGDTALGELGSKMGSAQIDFWVNNKETPRNIFRGLRLYDFVDFSQLMLTHWVKFVDHFNQMSTIDAVTSYSVMKEFDSDEFELARLLSKKATSPGIEMIMARLRWEQAQSWLTDLKNQVDVFRLLRLDSKDTSLFELPLKSWLAFVKVSSERNPNVIYHSIKQLKGVYSEKALAKCITNALEDPNTDAVATELEDDLIRKWFNDLKSPEDIDRYLGNDIVFDLLRSHYRQFYNEVGCGILVSEKPKHWLANYRLLSDFYQSLPPEATSENTSNGKLLYAYAMYVEHFNEYNRVEPLSLFALLRTRFSDKTRVDILIKGISLVKSKSFSLVSAENEKFARAVTHVQNWQIHNWLRELKLPDHVFNELGLDTATGNFQVKLDLWLKFVDAYNDFSNLNIITPYSVLKMYYNPLTLAHIFSKLTKSSDLEKVVKQIEEGVDYFWRHTDIPPDEIFKSLPLSFTKTRVFDQSTKSWLEFSDRYRKAHPNVKFQAIRILKEMYTDYGLIDMIAAAANHEHMKGVAKRLERDLWSVWVNDGMRFEDLEKSLNSKTGKVMFQRYRDWFKTTIISSKGGYRSPENYDRFDRQYAAGILADDSLQDGVLLTNIISFIYRLNKNHPGEPISVYALLRLHFDEASVFKLAHPPNIENIGVGIKSALKQLDRDQRMFWLETKQSPTNILEALRLSLDSMELLSLDRVKAFVEFSLDYSVRNPLKISLLTELNEHFGIERLTTWLFNAISSRLGASVKDLLFEDKSMKKFDLLKTFEVDSTTDEGLQVVLWIKYVTMIENLGNVLKANDQTILLLRSIYSDSQMISVLEAIERNGTPDFAEEFRQQLLHDWSKANLLPRDLYHFLNLGVDETSWGSKLYMQYYKLCGKSSVNI